MPNFCQLQIIGHLGGDATFSTVGDTSVAHFSVAYSPPTKKDADKEAPKAVTWVDVSWWNPPAFSKEALWKGVPVFVVGEFTMREWTDKAGGVRKNPTVNARSVVFLRSSKDTDDGSSRSVASSRNYSKAPF